MKNSKKWLRNSLILLLWPAHAFAVAAGGGDYDLTKTLIGASGISYTASPDYSMAYATGEDVAGTESQSSDYDLLTGYFGGLFGNPNFKLLGVTVGPSKILQDAYQVGVPLNASVQLAFSGQVDESTLANGIQVHMLMDHLAQPQNVILPSSYDYDVAGDTVIISPSGAWPGDALLDVVVNTNLLSIDSLALPQTYHSPFITMLDPHQENIVLHPVPMPGLTLPGSPANAPTLNLDIPAGSLADYSYVLVSNDPLNSPLRVDPKVLQTAIQRSEAANGVYQAPLAIQEIAAYNESNQPMSLNKAINYSISYNGSAVPIRADSLSLWTLDAAHSLWVKIPDSHAYAGSVSAPATQFSVYALMGSAVGDAANVYVFPLPWRPHGPNAGNGPGQTGTDADGITFNNLPSECTITIYTPSGRQVRELHHSDLAGLIGQEKWDGNTASGDHAASGVYLWRVESASDAKNGKLMLIR